MLEELARETSAAESWSPSTRRTLSIVSRELADVAVSSGVLQRVQRRLLQANSHVFE